MDQISRKGIRVEKGQSVMDAFRDVVPHWIHEQIKDPTYVTGFRYARECKCSVCGYTSSFEKDYCPGCRKKMRHVKGI